MAETSSGLDLKEADDDFALSVTGADGTVSNIRLTEAQVLALSQSALAFRERILLRHNPAGDSVSAVLVTPVHQIGLQPDSLGESVLLTLVSTTGGRLVFGLPPHICRQLLQHLPEHLAEIESAKPTRQ